MFTQLTFAGLFSYKEKTSIKLSKRVVFVGPNNGGKSNILRIIRILSDSLYQGGDIPAYKVSQLGGDPHVCAEISLSDAEARTLADFLRYGWDNSDKIHVSKLFDTNQASYFQKLVVRIDWKRKPDGSGSSPSLSLQFPKCGFGLVCPPYNSILHAVRLDSDTYSKLASSSRLNDFLRSIFKDGDPASNAKSFLDSGDASHQPVPFTEDKLDALRAEDRAKALTLLNELGLSVGSTVSLQMLIGSMMHRCIVHATEVRGQAPITIVDEIARLVYPPAGRDFEDRWNAALVEKIRAISMAETGHLEFGGHNMAQFLLHLKNSESLADIKRYRTIKMKFEKLFDGLIVEPIIRHRRIATGQGFAHIPAPDISITDKNLPEHVPFEQVGAGARNTLYLLTAVHGVKDSIVMLDEPGINLHPQLLLHVMRELETPQDGQILVVTHSLDLLRYEISAGAEVTHVKTEMRDSHKISKTKEANLADLVVKGYQIDLAVLFARGVILVEGESDSTVLLSLSNHMAKFDPKYDLTSNNIAVVAVRGNTSFPTYMKLLDAYDIPWIVLSDEDSKQIVFKNNDVSWICKDKIDGNAPIHLLKGDLEDELRSIDLDALKQARAYGKKSKLRTAIAFCKIMTQKNAAADNALMQFLNRCIELPGTGSSWSVDQRGRSNSA